MHDIFFPMSLRANRIALQRLQSLIHGNFKNKIKVFDIEYQKLYNTQSKIFNIHQFIELSKTDFFILTIISNI